MKTPFLWLILIFNLSYATAFAQWQSIPSIHGVQSTGEFHWPEKPTYQSTLPFDISPLIIPVSPSAGKKPTILYTYKADIKGQGYEIEIKNATIEVYCADPSGAFYAFQSIQQLQRQPVISCGKLVDHPFYQWRGLHLDVARHFFPVSFIKEYIDLMSQYKLNKLHLHLTDDQAWRLEIKKYPLLTEKAAFRENTDQWTFFPNAVSASTPETDVYGGYYSQEDIKALVAYGLEREVEIIPEIEMPGHCASVFWAFPSFSCKGKSFEKDPYKSFEFSDPFCAGNPEVQDFIADVIEEVSALFPSKYIHIGGDETKHSSWDDCPKCQTFMHDHNINDSDDLYTYFMENAGRKVNEMGKQPLAWDEVTNGGKMKDFLITAWQDSSAVKQVIDNDYKAVICNSDLFYFNKYQFNAAVEEQSEKGIITLKDLFAFTQPEGSENILGLEACLWTEYVRTPEKAYKMLFPRLLPFAEKCWNGAKGRLSYSFMNNIANELPYLQQKGIQPFIAPPTVRGRGNDLSPIYFQNTIAVALQNIYPGAEIFYRIGGKKSFSRYRTPINLKTTNNIQVFAKLKGNPSMYSDTLNYEFHKLKYFSRPVSVAQYSLKPGLECSYYTDSISSLKDYEPKNRKWVTTSSKIEIPNIVRKDAFVLRYEGYIKVNATGIHKFLLTSDDGSMLYINDQLVIDNDGVHAPIHKEKSLLLKKGLYKIRIDYFDLAYGEQLGLSIFPNVSFHVSNENSYL
ncbi:family 20 glycosylhydrolase [Persicobacter psychrovividus]|uniref:beta-N-acetylhexosaminidase n=1 Tax=Persicobacter psychrovividus TaxID=387638 RepID=A0ABN6LFI6_9BACT|nr:beta-N-acetylhexosaminidase [Persicobacter psychrovividus]